MPKAVKYGIIDSMNKQISFSEVEFGTKRKKTHKEIFFERMEKIVPIKEWCTVIEPYYYKKGNGRQPIDLEIMLKMYMVSNWFNLSDAETEDMANENLSVRKYLGIKGSAPDETTLCKFRAILEKNRLTEKIFASFNEKLKREHIILHEGTIVDATIIEAPKSRKNKERQRTPEMGATTKNGQAHYGIKAHTGMDKHSGAVHSFSVTPANVSDIEEAGNLVHGEEKEVYGDAGYIGIEKKSKICEKFQDGSGEMEWVQSKKNKSRHAVCKKRKDVRFEISKKRSMIQTEEEREREKEKSKIRIHIEHVYAVIKERFKCRKIVYRTLNKARTKMAMLFTLANVLTYERIKLSTK